MKARKVALLGNMNNNNFVLLRYFLDNGVDADLLLFDNEPEHFRPEADTFDIASYNDRIKHLNWGDRKKWFLVTSKQIANDLAPYDFLIGTDLSPAFCGSAGRTLDVFVPHGSDLGHFTYYKLTWPDKLLQTWLIVYMQKKYIPQVKYFHIEKNLGLYEKRWYKYKGNSVRWQTSLPLVYKENNENLFEDSEFIQSVKQLRQSTELLFYYNVRHVWGGDSKVDANQKGTDNLIRALHLFKNRNPTTKFVLVTFEYGGSYVKTKKLINTLGLERHVKWFPISDRKEILLGMKLSDIVFGEFANSWATYSVIVEALSLNKPIITYRDDSMYRKVYGDMYYILNAKSYIEICEKIEYYMTNKDEVVEKSSRGWSWYTDKIVNPALSLYINAINE